MLQAQLSTKDLEKAMTPTDFQLKKIVRGSNGVELVKQVRNKSLLDALTCAHLGMVLVKAQLMKNKILEEHQKVHDVNQVKEIMENTQR